MGDEINISATIVVYKEDPKILLQTIKCVLAESFVFQLYVIDNSPTNYLEKWCEKERIKYIHQKKNTGFGVAHNLVIDSIKETSDYHLVLNPDVTFNSNILPKLIQELKSNHNLSMISPKVVYPDNKLQYTCRKNPTLKRLLHRKFSGIEDEYQELDLQKPFSPDFIHGCFMLFKTKDFVNLEGFDKRYFMYLEDADICRKIKGLGKEILYYPKVKITHLYRKASRKNVKLFFIHLSSAIKYFRKWGFS